MLPEDPVMLVSVINMKLRDYYPTLDALLEDLDLPEEELLSKLAGAGFTYSAEENRFI